MAWRDPRVKSLTYYQWEDEPVRWRGLGSIAYAGWQSGLFYVDGRPKPAFAGFQAPFVVDRGGGGPDVRVWGQVRPGAAHEVTVERRSGSGAWQPLASVRTDGEGYFTRTVPAGAGERLRMTWPSADPDTGSSERRSSGAVTIGPRRARGSRLVAPSAP
jgi:hypothetical protein